MRDSGKPENHRLFIAIPLKLNDTNHIKPVIDELENNQKTLKIVPYGNYHLTLKFLGNVNSNVYHELIQSFETISIEIDPIAYRLKGIGVFPNLNNANIIWFGIDTDLDKINLVQTKIEDFCESFGFEREKRKFKPHMTIARVKKKASIHENFRSFIKSNENTVFKSSTLNQIILFESELKSNGPVYTELKSITL